MYSSKAILSPAKKVHEEPANDTETAPELTYTLPISDAVLNCPCCMVNFYYIRKLNIFFKF